MAIKWHYVTLSDRRVADFLSSAADAGDPWRSKIHLAKNAFGKTRLRVHRDRDGRYYVRTGWKGAGRSYLADRVELTTIDGEISTYLFHLDIYEPQAERS